MDDSELIASCRAGKTDAFEALVNKYQSPLLTMAWSVLGNKEDARDAAQQAFLSAFANLGAFDSKRCFKTWLFAIAWKDCLDMKRREKTRRIFFQRAKDISPLAENPGPAEVRLEESAVFSPVLKKLADKERLALCLRINDGCTAAEIAEVLGCAESSARVYVFNAIRKIRKMWDRGKAHV